MPTNQFNLSRKTRGIIAAIVIVVLAMISGAIFTHNYGYFAPVKPSVATVVESQSKDTVDEETVEDEEVVTEAPEETVTEEKTTVEETPVETEQSKNTTSDSFGSNVGKVVDKGVGVLKGGAGWLGEKLTQWGDD